MSSDSSGVHCQELCSEIDAVTGTRCVSGNRLGLLIDGDAYVPAMLDAIRSSEKTVDLELYRIHPGQLSALLVRELARVAGNGIRVRAVIDAVGSRATPPETWRSLIDSGVQLRIFAPVRLNSPRRVLRRNHRKILIVDDTVAFVGGMSFDDVFYQNPDGPTWRESMVRVEGPLLVAIARSFARSWREAGGETIGHREVPELEERQAASTLARFVASTATEPRMRAAILASIRAAERSIYITNPFVLPDDEMSDALRRAAKAGVDVRVLVPGGPAFDRFKTIRLAMNGLYEAFLKAGLRIFEYQPAMLHAKSIVVDQSWCSVGSTNLDARSFFYNHEADLISCDAAFVRSLTDAFHQDLDRSVEVRLASWQSRSRMRRLKELAAGIIRAQL